MRQFAFLLTALLLAAVGGAQTYFPGTAYHPGTTNVFPAPQSRGGTQFPPVTAAAADSTLLTGLVSYWPLNEQSGTRYDAVGSNDLTDNNTVGAKLRGPEGTVASFVKASNEFLSLPAPYTTPASGTVSMWVHISPSLAEGFYQWFDSSSSCWLRGYVQGGKLIYIDLQMYDGVGYSLAAVDWFAVNDSGWFLVTATWEAGAGNIKVYANNVVGSTQNTLSAPPVSNPILGLIVGAWAGSATCHNGMMGSVSYWSRVLTSDERAALFAAGNGLRYADLPAGLLTGLVSWWELDEVSGVRYDSHGSNDLTDNNTVGSVINAGDAMDGAAASFVAANVESVSIATPPDLGAVDHDYTISGWFKVAGVSGEQAVVSSYHTAIQYLVYLSGDDLIHAHRGGGPTIANAISADVWNHFVADYDAATGEARLSLNGSVPVAAAVSDMESAPGPFCIGAYADKNAGPFTGQVDEVAIWSRVLTADERTELWNAGAGKFYPFE